MNRRYWLVVIMLGCALIFVVTGCATKTIQTIEAVKVSVYDPFPPNNGKTDLHEFSLTGKELAEFSKLAPAFLQHNNEVCDCGIPQFWFKVVYDGGKELDGHFFHGPQKLKIEPKEGAQGSLNVDPKLHDYLASLIQERGWMKKDKP